MLLHYQIRICLSGHSKFDMDWKFFLQNCIYIKMLIIMFIGMFDVQYWKSNNICNTWKIKKGKIKNLNLVYLLKHINGFSKIFNTPPLPQAGRRGGCMPCLIDRRFIKWSVVYFNETPTNSTGTHKHLGMRLDSKLSYENHLWSVFSSVNKTIGLLRKFQSTLPSKSLVTNCKSFIRPHLDYGDVIYDWASNEVLNLFNIALEWQ